MTNVHLVFGDAHSKHGRNNSRALSLGRFIHSLKPDVVVDLGDTADLESLCSHEKGKRSALGRKYEQDVAAHNEFQDMLWLPFKKSKRKMPIRYRLIGNHEHRIERALDQFPEMEGTVTINDLQLERYYDEIVPYNGGTPGTVEVDGVAYSHYVTSGAMGRALGGLHHGYNLLRDGHQSATVGHAHKFSYTVQFDRRGRRLNGLCCPSFMDYTPEWVGTGGRDWSNGVVVKRGVSKGDYDLEYVSIDRIKKEFG